ncbi:hypothetical protein G6F23_015555 [Rhizopus arrhizus]|nr:hypothetical protein G6F23_015555 [Rhizopus arrhizus]
MAVLAGCTETAGAAPPGRPRTRDRSARPCDARDGGGAERTVAEQPLGHRPARQPGRSHPRLAARCRVPAGSG